MTLSDIAASLEAEAKVALAAIEAVGEKIVQELEPVVESAFAEAADQFGKLAVQTVVNLMTAAGAALTGSEKLNLTATTIVQAAEQAGVQIAAADVSALAKSAYVAVLGQAPGQ